MEPLIIYPNTKEESKALKTIFKKMKIPFESADSTKNTYNVAFEKKMKRAEQDKVAGRYKLIKTADLWK